jgi:hypothetical protein
VNQRFGRNGQLNQIPAKIYSYKTTTDSSSPHIHHHIFIITTTDSSSPHIRHHIFQVLVDIKPIAFHRIDPDYFKT